MSLDDEFSSPENSGNDKFYEKPCLDDKELYESPRRKQGWRFTAGIWFFIHTYGSCGSAGEGFIEFGSQDVENEQGQVA